VIATATQIRAIVRTAAHVAAAAALSAVLSGCGALPFGAGVPIVRITAPVDGATATSGRSIAILGSAGGAGVRAVRVMVNGEAVAVQDVTEMYTPVALSWMPDRSGVHVVHLEALDVDGTLLARSDLVLVSVDAPPTPVPSVTPLPTDTPAPTPTPEPTTATTIAVSVTPAVTVTSAPTTVAATATATATTAAALVPSAALSPTSPTSPTVTVIVEMANLRAGPGFDYPLAGRAAQGEVLPIVGRDAAGAWWQVRQLTATVWIAATIVETEATERDAAVVAVPTRMFTVTSAAAAATPTPTPSVVITPTPTVNSAAEGMAPCDENNPHWAVKESKDAGYTFCAAAPFEFVADERDGRMVLRWHMYGIEQLELRVDPNGSGCGLGTTGFREIVPFRMDAYEMNRRNFPRGGYKIGLWATLPGGRVQDYGELNFCGEG